MAPLKIKDHLSEIEMVDLQELTKMKNFGSTTDKQVDT
jgi:hypothetical protein